MKTFYAAVDIDARVEEVWQHIADLASYSEWHSLISSASGECREGAIVTIQVAKQPRPLKARIVRLEPNRELALATLFPLGLLRPVYTQKIELLGEGKVRYVNTEEFSGALLFLMAPTIDRTVGPLYEKTCLALRARVEAQETQ